MTTELESKIHDILTEKQAKIIPENIKLDIVFEDEDSVIAKSDIVFASLLHGVSEPIALKCHQANKAFIDLGADFRLYDEADYQEWYKLNYEQKELHEKAV